MEFQREIKYPKSKRPQNKFLKKCTELNMTHNSFPTNIHRHVLFFAIKEDENVVSKLDKMLFKVPSNSKSYGSK
jgi:hypothetical protein